MAKKIATFDDWVDLTNTASNWREVLPRPEEEKVLQDIFNEGIRIAG